MGKYDRIQWMFVVEGSIGWLNDEGNARIND